MCAVLCCCAGQALELIECCVRSPSFQAADMLAAGKLLQQACSTQHLAAALPDPAAVTALASALATVMKRAAVFIKAADAAGSSNTEHGAAGAAVDAQSNAELLTMPAADRVGMAARCFPAAAPVLVGYACSIADCLQQAVQGWVGHLQQQAANKAESTATAGCSSSSSSQSRASAALLAVLLARSAVVLADAMEAAAAAAGSTPAELLSR
jgi:hypothetical protein